MTEQQLLGAFKACIKPYLTQPVDELIGNDLFELKDNECVVNKEAELLKQDYFAPAKWMFMALVEEFLVQRLYWRDDLNTPAVQKEIRDNIKISLQGLLQSLIPGLDLTVVDALGAEKYESREGKGLVLSLIPFPISAEMLKMLSWENAVFFQENMRLHFHSSQVHALRKQLNMTEKAGSLALCCGENGDLYSIGILPRVQAQERFPFICFTGHMEWTFCVPPLSSGEDPTRLVCSGGFFRLPTLDLSGTVEIERIRRAAPRVTRKQERVILNLLHMAKKQKHGAILIIADRRTAARETKRLCLMKKRGIAFTDLVSLTSDSGQILLQLSSIDGALLVDLEGNCHACAVILDGKACVEGDMGRGARLNSTKNYIKILRGRRLTRSALGLVISEDGMTDII